MPQHRSEVLSWEQEVERPTTEEQIAENEGHEQFKESQRIEPAAKVQGGKGAANNTVDLKEWRKYNVLVMTLITTVTFAAAFQVPGGYDANGKANLVKSRDFRNFLIFDTLSFGSSAGSLLIYFFMPVIQQMTSVQKYMVQTVAIWLSILSLTFMLFAFIAGVSAVLDEKSSLYSLTNITIVYGWAFPIILFGTACHIFIARGISVMNKTRQFRS